MAIIVVNTIKHWCPTCRKQVVMNYVTCRENGKVEQGLKHPQCGYERMLKHPIK